MNTNSHICSVALRMKKHSGSLCTPTWAASVASTRENDEASGMYERGVTRCHRACKVLQLPWEFLLFLVWSHCNFTKMVNTPPPGYTILVQWPSLTSEFHELHSIAFVAKVLCFPYEGKLFFIPSLCMYEKKIKDKLPEVIWQNYGKLYDNTAEGWEESQINSEKIEMESVQLIFFLCE